jgi:hypothetical protein
VEGVDEPRLLCDSDRLRASLDANSAPALAQLLAAYRRSAPDADTPTIEARDGRYRLSAP